MPSIHIVNPKPSFTGYLDADALRDGERGWLFTANLAVVTVAALVPAGWDIRITDEQIGPIDFDAPADFVAITGQITQRDRLVQVAAEFRRRGRTVMIGGPFASLDPEYVRPHADILVTGELEELAPRLFAELAAGTWADRYDGGRADIRLSPLPRWDLYPLESAATGALQTTRGCPFDCEFCDVIQYQGRKQRHKTIDQVLAELDALYVRDIRYVFLVDDNFTVHRQFARAMLEAFVAWNARHADDPVRFTTQASLDIARDDDMLALCAAAGLRQLFVGIETVNADSLRETGKKQNLLLPMREAINKIVRRGIGIWAGIIVGFDHDGPEIFSELFDFFQETPVPDLHISVLTASKATRLHARLQAQGRLLDRLWEEPFTTNFIPAQMSAEALCAGARRLAVASYEAGAFARRVMNFIRELGTNDAALLRKAGKPNRRVSMMLKTLGRIAKRGSAEARMLSNVLAAANRKPDALPHVISYLVDYERARYYLDCEAALARAGSARAAIGARGHDHDSGELVSLSVR
jgi:radical SAM superfamily enzyme YgiQ (UPF0313 family)